MQHDFSDERKLGNPSFSPKEFIRQRRPEKFSDSTSSQHSILNRSQLEYHLDTLTSRSQENDFERFALALAKKSIAPNLRPLTGPTGGGDSKTDSETFPVHQDIAIGWHENVDLSSSSERWAFAFSAKKQWRSKVQSDVAKIAQTERGYKTAFFISNQFIRDKSRSEVEDELRNRYSIDVRILDRSWILQQIFTNRYEELAIVELGIEPQIAKTNNLGPRDTDRQSRLTAVETEIANAVSNQHFGPALVGNCIEVVKLARAIERPRTEVDGLIARAERMARSYGTLQQKVEAAYTRAWTAYWWHEDVGLFVDLYEPVEALALGSSNIYDLELLNNLWAIIYSIAVMGQFDRNELKVESRAIKIAEALQRLALDDTKPSAALHARTLLLFQKLYFSPPDYRDEIFSQLELILEECNGMIGFPVESIIELVIELGRGAADSPAYERLAEKATTLSGSRSGDVDAAMLLLDRGTQKLSDNRFYDAINLLGRALGLLSKHESQEALVFALRGIAWAYEEIGLLWAARGSLLTAGSLLVNRYHIYTDVSALDSGCFRRLRWLELQLGRIPHLLASYELEQVVRRATRQQDAKARELSEEDTTFDMVTGILLLRSNLSQLAQMTNLPESLKSLGMFRSEIAILYSLGHMDEMAEYFPKETEGGIHDLFRKWIQQPAANKLPARPELYDGATVIMTSQILSTTIKMVSENQPACLDISESLIAMLEAVLATAHREAVVAIQPQIEIDVSLGDSVVLPFEYESHEDYGEISFRVRVPAFSSLTLTREEIEKIQEKLWHLVTEIFVRAFAASDFEKTVETLFGSQLAAERAISYTGGVVAFQNIFGTEAKTTIGDWTAEQDSPKKLLRKKEWYSDIEDGSFKGFGKTQVTEDAVPTEDPRHSDFRNASLIRLPLWNEAGWNGALYATDQAHTSPGVLALAFRKEEPARKILEAWYKELGRTDDQDKLRITIIRGIKKDEPNTYRILIGTNLENYFGKQNGRFWTTTNRSVVLAPKNNENLDGFLQSFRQFGVYFLTYVCTNDGEPARMPKFDVMIMKKTLHVRDAWTIGVGDVDFMGVSEDDDPILPEALGDAPVLALIAEQKERSRGDL